MTTRAFHISRRRPLAGVLAAGAILASGAGLAVEQASAATAQVLGTTLVVNGENTNDRITLRLQAGVPNSLQVDANDDGTAEQTFDRTTFDRIIVNGRRGEDTLRIDDVNGTFTDTEVTTMTGGRDNDTLLGGRGNETFFGGSGNDTVDGNQGNDLAFLGYGDDTFIWDPGDGSDVVEGQWGYDRMDFRGANAAEKFDASANGPRLRFFRDLGNIVMDTNDVEQVDLEALGGADLVTVNDLRSTDVRQMNVDLANALGATAGDGAADSIVVNATAGDDYVSIRPENGRAVVRGLAPTVAVANAEAANDTLTLNALGGDDTVRFGKGLSALIRAIVNA